MKNLGIRETLTNQIGESPNLKTKDIFIVYLCYKDHTLIIELMFKNIYIFFRGGRKNSNVTYMQKYPGIKNVHFFLSKIKIPKLRLFFSIKGFFKINRYKEVRITLVNGPNSDSSVFRLPKIRKKR